MGGRACKQAGRQVGRRMDALTNGFLLGTFYDRKIRREFSEIQSSQQVLNINNVYFDNMVK